MRSGDRYATWQLVYSEVEAKAEGRKYNPCESFRSNYAVSSPLRKANRALAKISGLNGNTKEFDDDEKVRKQLPNWEVLGGEKGVTVQTRMSFVKSCSYWTFGLEPRSYLLYDVKQCESLFERDGEREWIVKQVQGRGAGDGLVYFASTSDLKKQFFPCKDMQPNWIAQEKVKNPLRLEIEKIKHPGRVMNILKDDSMTLEERRRIRYQRGKDDAEEAEDDELAPPFEDKFVQYDMRVYMLVSSISPLMVWYHDGYLRSVRPALFNGYYGFKLDEHIISFDQFQFYLASNQMTGANFLDSVIRPYVAKVMEYVVHSARDHILNTSALENGLPGERAHCQLFALNFVVDSNFRLKFVGISGDDSHDSFLVKHGNVKTVLENMQMTMKELVLEMKTAPIAFTRMRRGDTFGNFSLVFSELEEYQYGRVYDPCKSFQFALKNRRMYVTKEHLAKVADLQNFVEKQHASHLREMKKYVAKRWDYCKWRKSREEQASCIRNTITVRYQTYVKKERIPYDPTYVENKIKELQATHRPGKVPFT